MHNVCIKSIGENYNRLVNLRVIRMHLFITNLYTPKV